MIVVVTYDIGSNRRREQVSAVLEACGARVQLSVFECMIPSMEVLRDIKTRLELIIEPDEDQIRLYPLGTPATTDAQIIGNRLLQERQDFWIL
jgi:CRISPR-associated protein Cas2